MYLDPPKGDESIPTTLHPAPPLRGRVFPSNPRFLLEPQLIVRLTIPAFVHDDRYITVVTISIYAEHRAISRYKQRKDAMTTTKRRTETENVGAQIIVPAPAPVRNPGMPLDMDWVRQVRVNRSAVERRATTIPTRRTVKKEWQAAWLLRAITCIDLTTLQGDDTPGNVLRLCAKARHLVRQELLEAIGGGIFDLKVGAVCVYHTFVPVPVEALRGSVIPFAAVSTGFPAGQISFDQKLEEIAASVRAGATEIDIVISRAHVITGNWQALYNEVQTIWSACGAAHMKTIFATHELPTLLTVDMARLVCM